MSYLQFLPKWMRPSGVSALEANGDVGQFRICERHRLCYLPIQKNSCTFYKRLLIDNSDYQEQFLRSGQDVHTFLKTSGVMQLRDPSILSDPKWIRFVILREPTERIVSAYLNKFVANRLYRGALQLTRHYRESKGQADQGELPLTFAEFIDAICMGRESELDLHWRPQAWFVRNHLSVLDFQVPMTRIPDFLAILSRRIGKEIVNEKSLNQTKYGDYQLEEGLFNVTPTELKQLPGLPTKSALVSPELQEKLSQRYAEDFKLYADAVNRAWPELKD